jgi:hypothetical protein
MDGPDFAGWVVRTQDAEDAAVLRKAAAILERRYKGQSLSRKTMLSAAAAGVLEKAAWRIENRQP